MSPEFRPFQTPPLSVEDRFWGYRVATASPEPSGREIARLAARATAPGVALAGLAFLCLPASWTGLAGAEPRIAAALCCWGLALVLCLAFQPRASRVVEIDRRVGVIRDLRLTSGASQTARRVLPFAGSILVLAEPTAARPTQLWLCREDGTDDLLVAAGERAEIDALRRRIGRDLLIRQIVPRPSPRRAFAAAA